jgi:hypothetical protein
MDTKPAFCANCIAVTPELTPRMRKGRKVWLCAGCDHPLGELQEFDIADRAPGAVAGTRDGCRMRRGKP